MCERTFVACGGCDEPADTLRYRETRTESLTYGVDEDGDPTDILDSNTEDNGDGSYECPSCGWSGGDGQLDAECEPADCDCEECEPIEEDPSDEGADPTEIVVLSKSGSHTSERHKMWLRDELPHELRLLLSQRAKHYIAVRRERAADIYNNVLTTEDYPVTVDFDTPPCEAAIAELLEREAENREETIPLWA